MCTPLSAGKVEPPTEFSKRAGLAGSQFLDGVAGKDGEWFFLGDCSFT